MCPEYVTRTPTNGSAVLLSRVSVYITCPVYCTDIGGSSVHVIRTYLTYIRLSIILKHCSFLIYVPKNSENAEKCRKTPKSFEKSDTDIFLNEDFVSNTTSSTVNTLS